MKKQITGYEACHQTGEFLCEIGFFRDLLHFYGNPLSLPMCFGIASAMGFGYGAGYNTIPIAPDYYLPFQMVTGFSPLNLQHAFKATNIWVEHGRPKDKNSAWKIVQKYINEGRPVVVEVEMSQYLPLLKLPMLNLSGDTGNMDTELQMKIGGHIITVIGYNEEKNTATIIEAMLKKAVDVPIDRLMECRNVYDGYIAPENEWFVCYVPTVLPPIAQLIRYGIRHTVFNMMHPYTISANHYFGLKGIRQFTEEIERWPVLLSQDTLKLSCYLAYNNSDRICRKGGFGRKLWALFLEEAAEILKISTLHEIALYYWELRALWSEIALLFAESIHNPSKGIFKNSPAVKQLLNTIYLKEEKAIFCLDNLIKKWNIEGIL